MAVLTGCGTSGRALRDPAPGATAPPRKTSTTTAAAVIDTSPVTTAPTTTATPISFALRSPAWESGAAIPAEFTCTGEAQSPPLSVEGVPAGTAELVLLVRDTDDDGYIQWAVAGIPPADPSFPTDGTPSGAVELYNDGDVTSWRAPCPQSGTHTYEFTMYALAQPSGLSLSSRDGAFQTVADSAVASAAMTGTYARG